MHREAAWKLFLVCVALSLSAVTVPVIAQTFGLPGLHKKVVLDRKLPSIGRIEGATFKIVVTATSKQADLTANLKTTVESLLIHNDSALQTDETHPDTIITCNITSYDQPASQATQQTEVTVAGKNGTGPSTVALQRVMGLLVLSFQAKAVKSGRSLVADTVTAKFDQEYSPSGADKGVMHGVTNMFSHAAKGGNADDTPPTAAELQNKLIQDAALQIVSHFVTTTEQVEVYVASGKALDAAANMEMAKLWERSIEQLTKMNPFPKPEDDAYRIYDLGLANEALGYASPDIAEGLKYLEMAAGDYSKAIDAKPLEKNFLTPEVRIETAIAHYKILNAPPPPPPASPVPVVAAKAPLHKAAGSAVAADMMTNEKVVSMVSGGLDEANVIDTIQHAHAVSFDLSADAQVELSKKGVSGKIILAMKARSRTKH